MVNLGLLSGTKSVNSVKVSFQLPYYTHWGQSLIVSGSVPVLGSRNVKKGFLLSPVHQGDELIWYGSLAVPSGFECEYSYYVVDDEKNVLRWEMGKGCKLLLPEGIQNGQEVELHDLWQTGSDALPFRSAFKNVIFWKSCDWKLEAPAPINNIKMDQEAGTIFVQFKICCPNIEEDTSVYVIGNHAKLGQWKVHGGLKLNYGGESIWQADCVIPRGDFPMQYRYCKYDRAGNIALENAPNRELTIDSSNNLSRYIFFQMACCGKFLGVVLGLQSPCFLLGQNLV
ncbi:4-alpha-glucanotransferase dpe2-like protein [Quillaja saponaria]|uniref:4-alpha-glucanotransferase dpe2-like protein n=1 Tax=Quillaja saponaria TaxID=32244 RepID=A0AAD7PZM2_QUISA|nr:4-alpha-glucanotransferase dpe2-like protein [Quillaja saponaria]